MNGAIQGTWKVVIAAVLAAASVLTAQAQRRPYLGYAYPAGGQQGTTFEVKLGGQDLDDVVGLAVTGGGVTVRVTDYQRKIGPQEVQLLREQQRLLKAATGEAAAPEILAKVDERLRTYVQTPACAAIASIVKAEVTIAAGAEAGPRDLRLTTARGVSNALRFHVGQLPEHARKPMITAALHILGKEHLALRNRPAAEAEVAVTLPATLNGQIAARETNRYRFAARQGQRLVFAVQARELIPYVADAVPGWFQPVIALYDAQGREVAYADDRNFRPDPALLYQVPRDGEYTLEIRDSLYRGREDFVYRIAAGELPWMNAVFPLGTPQADGRLPVAAGWNLDGARLSGIPECPEPGTVWLTAVRGGLMSNRVPFAIGDGPELRERETGGGQPQRVTWPTVVNGRIGAPGERDTYLFSGRAGRTVVVEVQARRLESPLDAVVTVRDAAGNVVAANDDREDLLAGANTHHADPYLRVKLPADGDYRVEIADAAQHGGDEYGYRLRLGAPRPDFELRVVPSSVGVPLNGSAAVTVHVRRLDGFAGAVRVTLANPPGKMTAAPVTLAANQTSVRLNLRGGGAATDGPVALEVIGTAKLGATETVRTAIAAEDRMQAFLWRHLVPAEALMALVYDPRAVPEPKRPVPARIPPIATPNVEGAGGVAAAVPTATDAAANRPKFTKQQIAGRLRQLKLLYQEGLLTDAFYLGKVAECDTNGQ